MNKYIAAWNILVHLRDKVSPAAWRRRGRHTLAAPGWCACGKAFAVSSQSSPARPSSHSVSGEADPGQATPWLYLNSVCQADSCVHLLCSPCGRHIVPAAPCTGCSRSKTGSKQHIENSYVAMPTGKLSHSKYIHGRKFPISASISNNEPRVINYWYW